MNVKQREIWLVPFPFSDLSGTKVRPVLVLSKDEFNTSSEDVVVCSITSNVTKEYYSIIITSEALEEGNLVVQSSIKAENLVRLSKKLLIKKIGKLNGSIFSKVLEKMQKIFT